MSKIVERLLLKRLKSIVEERKLIPNHQFGFREKHSTIEQVHRITDVIEEALEGKQICSSIFLDVVQAFDKVWHRGLKYKLNRDLPAEMYQILTSYISDRHFRVKYDDEYSELKPILAGVPQGSVLGPVLYLLYIRDLPECGGTVMATFADDTSILARGHSIEESANKLQSAIDQVNTWTKKWRIKLNESKSTHINFTNRKIDTLPVTINSQSIPYSNTAKYLGITLDAKLRWREHVKIKQKELNIKYSKMYWLLGRYSELSLSNKIMLYKQVLKPIWAYGIQLWGCTKRTNIKLIQNFQNKVLRGIVNAPWFIRNDDIHRDLDMDTVVEETHKFALKHEQRLQKHENCEITQLLDHSKKIRRSRREPNQVILLN